MGAIHMCLQFLQFTVFVFIAGIDLVVLQPHFARQFCIMAVIMDLCAAEWPRMASKVFHILISFMETFQSVFSNKKFSTHLCDTHFIWHMMPWSSGFKYLVEIGSR
jgi:hypothetical protein